MKKILKISGILLIVILLVIQFFRVKENKSEGITANDITRKYIVPKDVQDILQTSCYDCHSNNTTYPWYAKVQPISWWLDNHIEEGKRELNFSEFTSYKLSRQYHKLEEIDEILKEGEMPLTSYTIIHKNAKLDPAQKAIIANWVKSSLDSLEANYPKDSLIRVKH